MPPITVRFDERTETRLRQCAESDGVTISDLVRRLVVEGLESAPRKETPYEAYERIFTGGTSGLTNLSRDYKKIVKEKVRAKHARRRRPADSPV